MPGYAGLVMILHFFVEFLLLLGADRFYGCAARWQRLLLGAGIGGLYAGACLLPRFLFLSSRLYRTTTLVLIGLVAYGISRNALRRCAVFLLLNMALDGVASGFSGASAWQLAAGTAVTIFLYWMGFHGSRTEGFVPVELTYKGKRLRMTALRDTGNTLQDPVTGTSVLILDAQTACQLTGLTRQQLRAPLETMVTSGVPGLRLIPYHTVGQSTGFMLALRMQQTKIGSTERCCLVALAPEGLNGKGTYQALIGGTV